MAEEPPDPFGSISIAEDQPDRQPDDQEPEVVIGPPEAETREETSGPLPSEQHHSGLPHEGPGKRKIPSRSSGRGKQMLAATLLFFLTYCLIGFLGVPYFLQSLLPGIAAKNMQRQVTFGSVRFNPFTLVLQLDNTIIGPQLDNADDTIDPIFSAARIEANISSLSLLQGQFICSSLTAENLFLHILRREDNTYNTSRLIPLQRSRTFPFLRLPFSYFISNLTVTDSRLLFDDLPAGRSHSLDKIDLSLPLLFQQTGQGFFSSFFIAGSETHLTNPHFSALINGSPVDISGESSVQNNDFTAKLKLQFQAVDVPSYLAYLPARKTTIEKGTADIVVDTTFHLAAGEKTDLTVDTQIRFIDLVLLDNKNNRSTFPQSTINASLSPLESRYFFHEISLIAPKIRVGRTADGEWSFPLTFPPPAAERNNEQPFDLILEKIEMTNGVIDFFDANGRKAVSSYSGINFSLSAFDRGSTTPAPFSLSAMTPEKGRVSAQGEIDPFSLAAAGLFTGEAIGLSSAAGSLLPAGMKITSGKIDTATSRFTWRDGKAKKKELLFHDGSVAIKDIVTTGQDTPLFSSPSLHLAFGEFDPFGRRADKITAKVINPEIRFFWDKDNRCNWSGPEQKKNSGENKRQWDINVTSLTLENGNIILADNSLPTPLMMTLEKIGLTATNLSSKEGETGEIKLDSTNFGQGSLTMQGPVSFSPFSASLNCSMKNFQLEKAPPLFTDWLNFPRLSGEADSDGELHLPGFSYTGSLEIRNFAAGKKDEADMAGWTKARSERISLKLVPFSLQAETVTLEEPSLQWVVDAKGMMNIADFFNQTGLRENGFVNDGRIALTTIDLKNGKLDFLDQRVSPPYAKQIEIAGTISNLVNQPANRLSLNLAAAIGGKSPGSLRGELGFFDGPLSADLQAEINQMPVKDFSPYLVSLLDYQLTKGDFNLAVHYKRENHEITADNSLVINDLELASSTGKSSASLPFAVALLTDPQGKMNVGLPFTGSTTDDSYTFPRSLGRAIRAMMLKSKVSPTTLLKADLQETDQLVDHLLFSPGKSALKEENKTALKMIARVLEARPLLLLAVKGFSSLETDKAALLQEKKERLDRSRLEEEEKKSLQITQKYGREEIGHPRSEQQEPPPAPPTKISVSKKELQELAEKRKQQVMDFFAVELKIPASRLKADSTDLIPAGAQGRPGNRVDLRFDAALDRQ